MPAEEDERGKNIENCLMRQQLGNPLLTSTNLATGDSDVIMRVLRSCFVIFGFCDPIISLQFRWSAKFKIVMWYNFVC